MRGLLASHAPPDRDDPALLRSFAVQVEETLTSGYDVDWHPGGDLLAVVNGGPTLQIFAAGSGTRDSAVETSGTRMEPGASPDRVTDDAQQPLALTHVISPPGR